MSLSFGVLVPFVEYLGFTLEKFEGGEAELHSTAPPEHLNSVAVTHGGALMTLLDVTMAVAARSVQQDMGVVTIEMKTTFMQPAKGELVCRGRLIHRSATLAFTEATVHDAQGRICSHATGTFKYVKRLPVSANQANAPQLPLSTD